MPIATTALLGLGLEFRMGNGSSPQTFDLISQTKSVTGFGSKAPLVPSTHYQSTAMEYIQGIPDGSEITVTCNHLPNNASQLRVIEAHVAKTQKDFKVIRPTFGQWNFSGQVIGYEIAPTIDATEDITYTIKISGAITYQVFP